MAAGNLITGLLKGLGQGRLQSQDSARRNKIAKLQGQLIENQLLDAEAKRAAQGQIEDAILGPVSADQPGGGPVQPPPKQSISELLADPRNLLSAAQSGILPGLVAAQKAGQPSKFQQQVDFLRQSGLIPGGAAAEPPSVPVSASAVGGESPLSPAALPTSPPTAIPVGERPAPSLALGQGAAPTPGGFEITEFELGPLKFKRPGDDPKSTTAKLQKDIRAAQSRGDRAAVDTLNRQLDRTTGAKIDPKDFIASRDRLRKASSDFLTQRQFFNSGLSAASAGTPFGDIALVFGFMKVLDPPSSVREGERASATNAAAIPQRVRVLYNKLLTGESLLPEQRQDIVDRMTEVFTSAREQQGRLMDDEIAFAERNGINPKDLIPGEVRLIDMPDTQLPEQADPSADLIAMLRGGGAPAADQITRITSLDQILSIPDEALDELPPDVVSALLTKAKELKATRDAAK